MRRSRQALFFALAIGPFAVARGQAPPPSPTTQTQSLPPGTVAPPPPPAQIPGMDHLGAGGEEAAGFAAANDGHTVKAREIGEKILARDPESYAGHFILGAALHRGEGDLPRAIFHLEAALKSYETRFGDPPDAESPWRWHASTLLELSSALGEVERCAEQLAILDKHDARYAPKRIASRIWPLMKLKRYDEARAAAKLAIEGGDPRQRRHALADLCGAESEAGDRQRAYEACTAATGDFRGDPQSGGQLEFANAADSALEVFRHDEAERSLKEAIVRPPQLAWVNPFQQLAELYLVEGRVPEAIDAMRGAQALRQSHPAAFDQFVQARLDGTLAELFLLVGLSDRAVAAARRAADQPDRQGHSSGSGVQAESAAAIVLAAALHDQAARAEEDAVTATFAESVSLHAKATWLRLEAWRARRRAAVALADAAFLAKSLRPYYLGMALPPWLLPDAIDAVGAGVALAGISAARESDRFPGVEKYFAAWQMEAAYARGDCEQARVGAIVAASNLPRAEATLVARMNAISAGCALRDGDETAATPTLSYVLAKDPGLLRRLDIALPVAIDSDGSALADRAATLAGRSPRFRTRGAEGNFRLSIAGGQTPRACLLGPSHAQIACATVNLPVDTADDAGARLLVAELHKSAFALKADLSQSDLTSLDGSPTAARADRQLHSVLDKLGDN